MRNCGGAFQAPSPSPSLPPLPFLFSFFDTIPPFPPCHRHFRVDMILITMKSKLAFALATSLLFSSCAQDSITGDTYSRGEAGRAQAVQTGRITSIRPVKIEGGSQGGALAGAIAGGVLGSNIGGGRASNTAGAIGGAMVGSAIGSQAQQAMTSRRGIEISVRLDQGGSVAIVQEVNPREQFSVGDRVRIISSGGRSRVSY